MWVIDCNIVDGELRAFEIGEQDEISLEDGGYEAKILARDEKDARLIFASIAM